VHAVKRGFWAHQIVEYLLGIAAIAVGAQSAEPLLPCVAGALLLLNAASTEGPLAAFRLVPRRFHRLLDDLLVVMLVAMAVFGGSRVDSTGRILLVGLAVVLAFVTWQTDYSTKTKRPGLPASERSEQIGRTAGRLTGTAVAKWRNRPRSS